MMSALYHIDMTESKTTEFVEMPSEMLEQLEKRVSQTEFDDASEYVTHLIEEVLYEIEQSGDESKIDTDTDTESVDEKQVQERLKSLGYLNE
jgi:Arc/MetJ-type ribon-helix-helix transcriptional regulator